MKHWLAFSGIVLFGIAAVIMGERRKVDIAASPSALLYLIADTEQELTRMPVSFTRMSDEDEIRIGNELARYYASSRESKEDPETIEVENYLSQVGSHLTPYAHRKLPYQFHYIPDKYLINAFALPGGHVYVGAGLLALMDSEDELAAVVGHEMEHIDHYHCAERVQREQALHKIPFGALVALPIEVFEAGYSKDQELEADREGERLAVQAGYSANGAIRMFETFARLYEEYRARRARTPQEELSDVARQTLEGYFRSHPSPAERIEQVQKMIASESWPVRPERDLLIAYVFWTAQARTDFESGKYSRAQQLATRSLQVKPKQEKALEVLAKAQFAQADFAAAANSYRRLLELNPSKEDATREYALALAADRRSAAAEFQRWMDTLRGDKPQDLRVSAAGLDLLAGDATAARSAIALAKASPGEDWAPKWLADLAWWYYLAGDYPVALELATDAVQQRPSVNRFVTEQVWIQIENRRLADALENLNTRYTSTIVPDRTMARAVALWQARQQDTALSDFQIAIERQPQWENPLWIKAVYSPLVAQSIHEMQAERERRKVQVAGSR